jgi:SNF2 family DNA or RNA helicase
MANFYHDKTRNLLVYRSQSPFVLQAIPEARQINGEYIAIPRTLRNSQIMRHFDYPVAPVMTDASYDWPIEPGRRPLAHQKVMANFQVLHPRCFNLSDMGTMKTLASLWAADWLMKRWKGECRALIVAPLSTLERVWANAIWTNFLGRRTFEILHGNASKRQELLAKKADFSICNFDGVGVGAHTRKRFELDGFSKALADDGGIRIVICDEASAYKDARTKRHRIARLIIGKRDYLWLLSGTPTPNAPTDAYGLAKLVNNAGGKSFQTFQRETMIQVTNFKWHPQRDGYDKARRLLSPSIRYDIRDVWDGPEMTTQQRAVELTPDQKRLMADLKRDLQVVVKSGQPITATNEAAARQKFLQISLGAIYDEGHRAHAVDAHPRIEELRAVIEQAPLKLLLMVPLTSVVNLLYKELGRKRTQAGKLIHAGWSREIVNGDVGQKERASIFRRFQSEDDPRILIADPGTMAHGLDLWRATTVVWYGPTDKTELYLQANKRAHRPGQKHPVTVVQIVSNPLEREIYRRLETNTSLQGALLQMVRDGAI